MRSIAMLIAVTLWPASALAQGEDCPVPPDDGDAISVSVDIPDYRVDHTLSAVQLTARFRDRSLQPDMRIEGFADISEAEIRWQWWSVESRWPDDPKGTGCVAVNVDVTFVFDQSVVLYVASDYPDAGSCYDAVLRHEEMHYGVTMDLVETFGRRLRPALENDPNIAKKWNPVRFHTGEEREAALNRNTKRVERIVTGYVRRLNDDISKANKRLDLPSSYERVYADCTD